MKSAEFLRSKTIFIKCDLLRQLEGKFLMFQPQLLTNFQDSQKKGDRHFVFFSIRSSNEAEGSSYAWAGEASPPPSSAFSGAHGRPTESTWPIKLPLLPASAKVWGAVGLDS